MIKSGRLESKIVVSENIHTEVLEKKDEIKNYNHPKSMDLGEAIRYLVMGGLTTVVSWGTYALFARNLGMEITVSNILSWVCAVIFAYLTNKVWVFHSYSWKVGFVLREVALFISARLMTGVIEMAGVPLLVKAGLDQKLFGVKGMLAKVVVSILVVILNYVFSKLIIFRRKEKQADGRV